MLICYTRVWLLGITLRVAPKASFSRVNTGAITPMVPPTNIYVLKVSTRAPIVKT